MQQSVSKATEGHFKDLLDRAQPGYEIPEDDLVGEVLLPALGAADSVDISVGFFTSHSLSQIAPGLVSLMNRDVTCRLLISPELSDEDRDAINRGIAEPSAVIDSFVVGLFEQPSDALSAHTADCLAYLVATGTFEVRCVLMDRGMYHKKVWLIGAGDVRMAVHGSGNLTARGLFVNGEQMTVDRPWLDGHSADSRVRDLARSFALEWANKKADRLSITPTQLMGLLRDRSSKVTKTPTTEDFWVAWAEDRKSGIAPPLPPGIHIAPTATRFAIPEWLDWKNPPYAHQERALAALGEHDYRGILAIATGGGKTKTSLLSCAQVQAEHSGPLFVLILVPTRVLATQWVEEVKEFGVSPTILSGASREERTAYLEDIAAALGSEEERTEVAVATLQLFTRDEELRRFVKDASGYGPTILIADEVHNFGAPGFISDPPESFEYRIGLSATPVRQYDVEGTVALFEYFHVGSEPTFTFTLGEAIKSGCLVPYDYVLHPVEFGGDEIARYSDLTEQLARAGFTRDEGEDVGLTDRQKQLLRQRRSLVEQADAKLDVLKRLLATRSDDLHHALIYCSAKQVVPPHATRQIELARELLRELRIDTHLYTAVETGRQNSSQFLEGFAAGTYPVLLAMKVLDEGVDVPAAREAFLLASSTIEREWVQRRGRVLRTAPGKTRAILHDFMVVPPDPREPGARGLIQAELRRAQHFADDAENKYDPDGPIDVIRTIEDNL